MVPVKAPFQSILGGHRVRSSCVHDHCPNIVGCLYRAEAGEKEVFLTIIISAWKGWFVPVFSFKLSCSWIDFLPFIYFFLLHKVTCLWY